MQDIAVQCSCSGSTRPVRPPFHVFSIPGLEMLPHYEPIVAVTTPLAGPDTYKYSLLPPVSASTPEYFASLSTYHATLTMVSSPNVFMLLDNGESFSGSITSMPLITSIYISVPKDTCAKCLSGFALYSTVVQYPCGHILHLRCAR
jgi:hypothetical protein